MVIACCSSDWEKAQRRPLRYRSNICPEGDYQAVFTGVMAGYLQYPERKAREALSALGCSARWPPCRAELTRKPALRITRHMLRRCTQKHQRVVHLCGGYCIQQREQTANLFINRIPLPRSDNDARVTPSLRHILRMKTAKVTHVECI